MNNVLPFDSLDPPALMERVVPRKMAVGDEPLQDVLAGCVRDLLKAAHSCRNVLDFGDTGWRNEIVDGRVDGRLGRVRAREWLVRCGIECR